MLTEKASSFSGLPAGGAGSLERPLLLGGQTYRVIVMNVTLGAYSWKETIFSVPFY